MSAVVTPHPRWVELVARRQLRTKVERAIDRLLAILDDLDGDPDLEEQDENGDPLDRGEHDTADHEPWLGAAEDRQDQRRWSAGSLRDLEADLDCVE